MFRGDLISQAVTGHFGGLVGDGICFGKPPHHLKLNSLVVLKGWLCIGKNECYDKLAFSV